MANCKQCGQPLKKGNIKVVRKPGKRTYRVCRHCPQVRSEAIQCPPPLEDFAQVPKVPGETVGDVVQRPQDTTGGPWTGEVVYSYSTPTWYRFFMTRDQAEKVKASVEKNVAFGFGVSFEVIPVLAHLVDQDPDAYADLVEVKVDWGFE